LDKETAFDLHVIMLPKT